MFDLLNGGDERISFLVEYLVTKGAITENAATWINKAGGSLGIKTNFFLKSENKVAIVGLMDKIDHASYQKILEENLICKTCGSSVSKEDITFTSVFTCSKCGILKDQEEVEINQERVYSIIIQN